MSSQGDVDGSSGVVDAAFGEREASSSDGGVDQSDGPIDAQHDARPDGPLPPLVELTASISTAIRVIEQRVVESMVIFRAQLDGDGMDRLFAVGVTGIPALQEIAQAPPGATIGMLQVTPDAAWAVYVLSHADRQELWAARVDGSAPTTLITVGYGVGCYVRSFQLDARSDAVVYLANKVQGAVEALFVARFSDLANSEEASAGIAHPVKFYALTAGGSHLVLGACGSGSDSGRIDILSLLDGSRLTLSTDCRVVLESTSFSPDGQWIFYPIYYHGYLATLQGTQQNHA